MKQPGIRLMPCTISRAREFVGRHHRHNKPPQGGLFAVGASVDGELIGVAIIGRPIARMLDDGKTCEVTRLCTNGVPNSCSLLYGAATRAAKALGWHKIITYTLQSEPGTSLRASGWKLDAEVKSAATWSCPSRKRDNNGRPTESKNRWAKTLCAAETMEAAGSGTVSDTANKPQSECLGQAL